MAYLEALWPALCSGPLELVLQYLTLADCNALQRALRQLRRADGQRYDLRDALPSLDLRRAWNSTWVQQMKTSRAHRYYKKHHLQAAKGTYEEMLVAAAARGHDKTMEWCSHHVKTWRSLSVAYQLAMQAAAGGGHMNAVKECHHWLPAHIGKDVQRAIKAAAANGHDLIVIEIVSWGGDHDFLGAMVAAARGGHLSTAQECRSQHLERCPRSPRDELHDAVRRALKAAAENGHLAVLQLCQQWLVEAKEWTVCSMEKVIVDAARNGHADILQQFYAWGDGHRSRPCFTGALSQAMRAAAAAGHYGLMRQCKYWGADAWHRVIDDAARAGRTELVRECRAWGVAERFLHEAMASAAEGGHTKLLEQFRAWGVDAYCACIERATEAGREAVAQQCREWAAEVEAAEVEAARAQSI